MCKIGYKIIFISYVNIIGSTTNQNINNISFSNKSWLKKIFIYCNIYQYGVSYVELNALFF